MPADGYRSIGARTRAVLFALLAALLVFATEQVIEHFARQRALEQERNGVLNELSALRARLEGVVNANLFLTRGLAAVIAARPDIDQAGFDAIARNLVDERHALRNIAAAPNMVISLMYPLAGNEAALGLDYRTHPEQREAALRARDSGRAVLAGPLRLAQGGIGIVAREPVFLAPARPGGERRFWGLVSAVIDVETLYRLAGLRDQRLGLHLALRGSDGTGHRGPVFFGDAALFDRQPVALDVTLPGGSWQIAAIPVDGWGRPNAAIDLIRLMGLLAALMGGIMAYRLVRGAQTLAGQSARLRGLFSTLPDLFFLMDPDGTIRDYRARQDDDLYVPPEAFLDKRMQDVLPAGLGDLFQRKMAEIGAQGGLASYEYDLPMPDGMRHFEARLTRLPDSAQVIAVVRDITGPHQDRLALSASEDRYRQLFEHNPAPMLVYEKGSLRLLAVNEAFTGHYGYSLDEALALRLTDLYPEEEKQPIADLAAGLSGLSTQSRNVPLSAQ